MPRKQKDEAREAPQAEPQPDVPRDRLPGTVEYAEAQRQRDDERMRALSEAHQQMAVETAAGPDDNTENVLVAKRDARAARQEQEAIDQAKRAAENAPPPRQESEEVSPEEGTVPEPVNPMHPFVPGPAGSAPHSPTMPAGPMGEKVVYVTDDITADGTPLIQGQPEGVAEPDYDLDGENNRRYSDIQPGWENHPADADADKSDPLINRHSPEGAKLEQMRYQRDVVYVPQDTEGY